VQTKTQGWERKQAVDVELANRGTALLHPSDGTRRRHCLVLGDPNLMTARLASLSVRWQTTGHQHVLDATPARHG
jgi:hypothetical protein